MSDFSIFKRGGVGWKWSKSVFTGVAGEEVPDEVAAMTAQPHVEDQALSTIKDAGYSADAIIGNAIDKK